MAIDLDAVDFLHVVAEEVGDVFIGGPVDRHTQLVAILGLELFLQLGLVEPVLAEPVEVGELLVGKLVELAVRTGGELGADEVGEARIGLVLPVARHHVGEVVGLLQARVRADQVGIVDIAVVQVAVGLHLRLDGLHHFALAEDLVVDLDAGDFLEGLGQHLRFIVMRRNAFRQHVDLHALEGLGGLDEPFHLLELVLLGEGRRLEL